VVAIPALPTTVQPGQPVSALLPVSAREEGSILLPLDTVTVRQTGTVLFVNDNGVAREVAVDVIGYDGAYVEAVVDLPLSAQVVTTGNRLLQDGESIESATKS